MAHCREGHALPSFKIPIVAPASEHQHVCLKLLDQHWQLLDSWSHHGCQQQQQQQHKQKQHSHMQHNSSTGVPLVYQQQVADAGGQKQVLVGHMHKTASLQELWVSLPAPGTYHVHVSCQVLPTINVHSAALLFV